MVKLIQLARKASTIPGAGDGLFANEFIKQGATVCTYNGVNIDKDEVVDMYMIDPEGYLSNIHPYVRDFNSQQVVVGVPSADLFKSGVMVNDGAKPKGVSHDLLKAYLDESHSRANVAAISPESSESIESIENIEGIDSGPLAYQATRDINSGEELFACYGVGYWLMHMGITPDKLRGYMI